MPGVHSKRPRGYWTRRRGPDPRIATGMTDPEAVQLATIDWTRGKWSHVKGKYAREHTWHLAGDQHRSHAAGRLSRQAQAEPGEPVCRDGGERAHAVMVARRVSDGGRGRDLSGSALPYIRCKKSRFDGAAHYGIWRGIQHDWVPSDKDFRPCATGTANSLGGHSYRRR